MAACIILSLGVYMLARYWSSLALLWISATIGNVCAAAAMGSIYFFIQHKQAIALAQGEARRGAIQLAGLDFPCSARAPQSGTDIECGEWPSCKVVSVGAFGAVGSFSGDQGARNPGDHGGPSARATKLRADRADLGI